MRQNWYILYTKPQCERKVAQALTAKGFTNFCPLNKAGNSWYEKKKEGSTPLFSSYVFVKTSSDQHRLLKEISGVIGLVYWLDAPAVVNEQEIETIRSFVSQYQNISLQAPGLNYDWSGANSNHTDQKKMEIVVQNHTAKVFLASLGKMMYGESRVASLEVNRSGVSSNVPALQFS